MPKTSVPKRNLSRKHPITKPKDPKASHLYTDDNPQTTLHGTGFKDRFAAEKTLDLVKDRSLTYQFQTINTMYYRAKHHPSMKGGETARNHDMREAMDILKNWLDVTYPKSKNELRFNGFKPLLSKDCVRRWNASLPKVNNASSRFAEMYDNLSKGKRLANVLVDKSKPTNPDWEQFRYNQLCKLVDADKNQGSDWTDEELWEDTTHGKQPSSLHFEMIGLAWSPVGEKRLNRIEIP